MSNSCEAAWSSIAFGHDTYVAVASSGEVAILDHCGKWTLINAPAAHWTSITYHAGTFIAVSLEGLAIRSTDDGLTWYPIQLPGVNWTCLYGCNGVFCAVAAIAGNPVARSTDLGLTWSTPPAPIQFWKGVAAGVIYTSINNIPYTGLRWVAVADEPTIPFMFSDDQGFTWSIAPERAPDPTQPEILLLNERSAPGRRWQSIAYGDGLFCVVGKGFAGPDRTALSGDGLNWRVVTPGALAHWSYVTYWQGAFVAVAGLDAQSAGDRLMTMPSTSPGSGWYPVLLPAALPMSCVTGGNRGLIALANDGPEGKRAFMADDINSPWSQHYVIPCTGVSDDPYLDYATRFAGGRSTA